MGHEAEKLEVPERIRKNSPLIPAGVINAYVYGRLTYDQKLKVEQAIEESKHLQKLVVIKQLERLELRKQIPNMVLSLNSRKSLSLELEAVTQETFPPKKETMWDKISKFLDKTIFEF